MGHSTAIMVESRDLIMLASSIDSPGHSSGTNTIWDKPHTYLSRVCVIGSVFHSNMRVDLINFRVSCSDEIYLIFLNVRKWLNVTLRHQA